MRELNLMSKNVKAPRQGARRNEEIMLVVIVTKVIITVSDRTRKCILDDTKKKLRANNHGIKGINAHNPPVHSFTVNMAMT